MTSKPRALMVLSACGVRVFVPTNCANSAAVGQLG